MATILVIEDIPSVMQSLRIVLEGTGHTVRCAAGGEDGLAALRCGGIDLVVTDIWMPDRLGSSVIAEGRPTSSRRRGRTSAPTASSSSRSSATNSSPPSPK